MPFSPDTTVGHLAAQFPGTSQAFRRLGIEPCCDGNLRLAEVCRERHLPYNDLLLALTETMAPTPARSTWAARPATDLTSHLVEAFHDPLPEELPRLHHLGRSCSSSRQRTSRKPFRIAPMHHSIDFHAATVAADDKWQMILPGQSIRFEWVANYPGVYMYHCGVPPVLQHVAMGQYGIVIVSPREGYSTDEEAVRKYAVVQSEFYLKPGGEGGLYELDYDAALRKQPSHVLFNGHATALSDQPLVANAGERVRLYFHNVGPNDQSSTHVIGAIFDRVWYEGNPKNEWRGMQTALIGSSNGAVLEFIVPEEGRYVLVDHEFADASKGAIGQILAFSKTGTMTKHTEPMQH